MFRRPTMNIFLRFSSVVGRRQTIFIVFCISSADDGRFFPFSTLRPRPKHNFPHFLLFAHGRNAAFLVFHLSPTAESLLFPVFYSSATAETQFSPFSARRPRPKRRFHPISDKKMRFFGSQRLSLKYKNSGGAGLNPETSRSLVFEKKRKS